MIDLDTKVNVIPLQRLRLSPAVYCWLHQFWELERLVSTHMGYVPSHKDSGWIYHHLYRFYYIINLFIIGKPCLVKSKLTFGIVLKLHNSFSLGYLRKMYCGVTFLKVINAVINYLILPTWSFTQAFSTSARRIGFYVPLDNVISSSEGCRRPCFWKIRCFLGDMLGIYAVEAHLFYKVCCF